MEQLWDPLRHKNVAATPEERVRQWCIAILAQSCGVPMHQMMSETGFRFGGKQYRADILVYAPGGKPLAVVECKRPDVEITLAVAEQAMRYNAVLDVKWIFLTNGLKMLVFKREGCRFVQCGEFPQYAGMTAL